MQPSSSPRILLTGASGSIGTSVLQELLREHPPSNITAFLRPSKKSRKWLKKYPGVRVVFGSITDPTTLAEACKNQEVVIHLAGIIPPAFDKNPELGQRSNTEGCRLLIAALRQHAPTAFLLFSSSVTVYGDRLKTPWISVEDPLPNNMEDGYANSKIAAEDLIQNSGLRWSIFRLTAIMGIGNHKVSKILFHVPLETPLEIATMKDTARAFRMALDHLPHLEGKIYNLSGGATCRVLYKDFLQRAFYAYGLGQVNFPKNSFAEANFHCAYFTDADELENILHFRTDSLESYFEEFTASVPFWMRSSTRIFRGPVKYFLGRLSEPRKALKTGNQSKIRQFFGENYPNR